MNKELEQGGPMNLNDAVTQARTALEDREAAERTRAEAFEAERARKHQEYVAKKKEEILSVALDEFGDLFGELFYNIMYDPDLHLPISVRSYFSYEGEWWGLYIHKGGNWALMFPSKVGEIIKYRTLDKGKARDQLLEALARYQRDRRRDEQEA